MFEDQATITIREFKAWLAGFLSAQQGQLPDAEAWEKIQAMLDKVHDAESAPVWISPWPTYPTYPNPTNPSTPDPYTPWITYGDSGTISTTEYVLRKNKEDTLDWLSGLS